jgi:hypothetical protein
LKAVYLIRFDDICPTMPWKVWDEVESFLMEAEVKPILAVVPDNQDPKLEADGAREDFWERVRRWQGMGWTIGLHGYQHLYVNRNPGMLGLNPDSEFSGLPFAEQDAKIRAGLGIFESHSIKADTWIAPSHSFDATTLEVLRRYGITSVSDGYYMRPGVDRDGMFWMPQQIWKFRPMPPGIWTVCYHHAEWNGGDVEAFKRDVLRFRGSISDFRQTETRFRGRRIGALDLAFSKAYGWMVRAKRGGGKAGTGAP